MTVWIGYALENDSFVGEVADWLGTRGLWLEHWTLDHDDSLVQRVRQMDIQPTDRLIVALSPQSVGARWVRQELNGGALLEHVNARSLSTHFVVPALLKPCEVPLLLRDRMGANFVNKPFEAACEELHATLVRQPVADGRPGGSNRVFRSWAVEPANGGQHALVMEFGVCMQRTHGLHVEIDLGAHYTCSKDWFGPPNKPVIPRRPGGPFFNSSLRRQPPIYARKFTEPDITPDKSYYLYVEAEEPLQVTERLFLDAHDREI